MCFINHDKVRSATSRPEVLLHKTLAHSEDKYHLYFERIRTAVTLGAKPTRPKGNLRKADNYTEILSLKVGPRMNFLEILSFSTKCEETRSSFHRLLLRLALVPA